VDDLRQVIVLGGGGGIEPAYTALQAAALYYKSNRY
jgi:hypothetical protein